MRPFSYDEGELLRRLKEQGCSIRRLEVSILRRGVAVELWIITLGTRTAELRVLGTDQPLFDHTVANILRRLGPSLRPEDFDLTAADCDDERH